MALRIENSHTQIALFSKKIRHHIQQMPFFENTEVLRRDVQVLDHILTMEIKTHFILNLRRLKITTANACANMPRKTVGIYGGEEDAACPLPAFWYSHAVQSETTYCHVYIMYVIIRNVFKTIYDVYISYFKLSFYITIIFRINVTLPLP
jgi:hypothetical protein